MTGVMTMDHEQVQDLALDAVLAGVEPDDRAGFDAHAADCDQCRAFLDDLNAMVGLMGAVGEVEAPPSHLRAAILAEASGLRVSRPESAAAEAEASGPLAPRPVEPALAGPGLRGRRRAARSFGREAATRLLAVAAVIALIGLVGWGVTMREQRDDARQAAAEWSQFHDWMSRPGPMSVAEVDAADGSSPARLATAYVRDSGSLIVADRLAVNDTSSTIYVLWSMTSPTDGTPVALGSFDVGAGDRMSFVAGTGAAPSGLWFAISEEPGRRIPAAPTTVLGAGRAA